MTGAVGEPDRWGVAMRRNTSHDRVDPVELTHPGGVWIRTLGDLRVYVTVVGGYLGQDHTVTFRDPDGTVLASCPAERLRPRDRFLSLVPERHDLDLGPLAAKSVRDLLSRMPAPGPSGRSPSQAG